MRRLLPEPGETSVDELMDGYRPFDSPPADRPFVAVNMVTTLDGRASVRGSTKDLGSEIDSELLLKLRRRFDAVVVGAGTIRAERYGRIVKDAEGRARREQIGLAPDPLTVILSNSLELPFDAPIFTCGAGRILVFTSSDRSVPETPTALRIERINGPVLVEDVLRHLRERCGVRAVLCEGGPRLFAQLEAAETVDDLFLTISPELVGGESSLRILEGVLAEPRRKRLEELLEHEGELFARYRVRR
jgi:riboflavin biosynthesis pyrimidine reductase